MLLTQQQRILVKRKYDNGEGLNIPCIRRHHPDIIKKVFNGNKPMGWRKTLLALDIDPYSIQHEYSTHVRCKICGHYFKNLAPHLKVHGINVPEYLEEFGSLSETTSDEYRQHKFIGNRVGDIRHWENHWSPLYLLDYLIAIEEAGLITSSGWVCSSITIGNLIQRYFGSWDNALNIIGAEKRTNTAIPKWDPETVIKAMRKHAYEDSLNKPKKIPTTLTMAMRRVFGSTKNALNKASIDYNDFYGKPVFSSEMVNKTVLDFKTLIPLKGIERKKKFLELCKTHQTIIKGYFRSAKNLAKKNDIPSEVVSLQTYRNQKDVTHDLTLIKQHNPNPTLQFLLKNNRSLHRALTEKGFSW